VLVAVPGLRWQDLEAIDAEHVMPLLDGSALLSVRSIGPETSTLEGYLAVGAGNRLEPDGAADRVVTVTGCAAELIADARAGADDDLNGAEPGALGTALHAAGKSTAVFGSPVAISALMDADGCVDVAGAAEASVFDADVTLIELGGLETESSAAERAVALREIDERLGRLAIPDDATVMLFAPSAPDDADEVLVVGVRDVPGDSSNNASNNASRQRGPTAALVSPSTRRAGYVQLIDLGPTVLDVLGLDAPSSMSGTVIAAADSDSDAVDPAVRAERYANTAERVAFRDRAVGPVSVVLVVLLVLCGAAALAGRNRPARMLAPIVAVYPTLTFLMGLVPYHELPLDFVVVAIPVLSMLVAAVVVSSTSRWGPWAPITLLIGALWLMLIVDIVTGGALQINTPLGYSPTVAGRFQGFGNLSFGLVGAASIVVALVPVLWPAVGARFGLTVIGWASWVGAITVLAVAAPPFGSDVGGTLAVVPAFAALLAVLSGRRIRIASAALVAAGAVAVVVVLAFIDRSRAPSARTHLGRFLDDALGGRGWLIIRRKLHGNLSILTSSFWSIVLIAVIAIIVGYAWRRRATVSRALEHRPAVRGFLAGFAIVAVLGFALNDSGLAVPAIMFGVAIPWLVAVLVPVVARAGR
jgi:hypothetical protein